jgi:hypothetical protein
LCQALIGFKVFGVLFFSSYYCSLWLCFYISHRCYLHWCFSSWHWYVFKKKSLWSYNLSFCGVVFSFWIDCIICGANVFHAKFCNDNVVHANVHNVSTCLHICVSHIGLLLNSLHYSFLIVHLFYGGLCDLILMFVFIMVVLFVFFVMVILLFLMFMLVLLFIFFFMMISYIIFLVYNLWMAQWKVKSPIDIKGKSILQWLYDYKARGPNL